MYIYLSQNVHECDMCMHMCRRGLGQEFMAAPGEAMEDAPEVALLPLRRPPDSYDTTRQVTVRRAKSHTLELAPRVVKALAADRPQPRPSSPPSLPPPAAMPATNVSPLPLGWTVSLCVHLLL